MGLGRPGAPALLSQYLCVCTSKASKLSTGAQGGFIWDWVDQGLKRTDAAGNDYWAYGGTHFTCFTGTKVQILTLRAAGNDYWACGGTHFTCFAGTKSRTNTDDARRIHRRLRRGRTYADVC